MTSRIKRLDKESSDIVSSLYAISSWEDCLNKLIGISLEAKATHLQIKLGQDEIIVSYDGIGIQQEELMILGEDQSAGSAFGNLQPVMASIRHLARSLEIISRPQLQLQAYRKIFSDGKLVSSGSVQSFEQGTQITVRGLFSKFGIRSRLNNLIQQLPKIKTAIQMWSLGWSNTSFVVSSLLSRETLVAYFGESLTERFHRVCGTSSQLLRELKVSHCGITIQGLLGRAANSKKWKHLYINHRPATNTHIQDQIKLLSRSVDHISDLSELIYAIRITTGSSDIRWEGSTTFFDSYEKLDECLALAFGRKEPNYKKDPEIKLVIQPKKPKNVYRIVTSNGQSITSRSMVSGSRPSQGIRPHWISIKQAFLEWKNPVFSSCQDKDTFQVPTIKHSQNFSKAASHAMMSFQKKDFDSMRVIGQMDQKFIVCSLNVSARADKDGKAFLNKRSFVIIDQHAADERIRVEKYIRQYQECRKQWLQGNSLNLTALTEPLKCDVSSFGLSFQSAHLSHWGILAQKKDATHLRITHIPSLFANRALADCDFVSSLVRSHLATQQEHGLSSSSEVIPSHILNILNSLACRSAIMFGDSLSQAECIRILSQLRQCQFPFQCAHGRPSIVPLFLS